jgi:hypothetical protein
MWVAEAALNGLSVFNDMLDQSLRAPLSDHFLLSSL